MSMFCVRLRSCERAIRNLSMRVFMLVCACVSVELICARAYMFAVVCIGVRMHVFMLA